MDLEFKISNASLKYLINFIVGPLSLKAGSSNLSLQNVRASDTDRLRSWVALPSFFASSKIHAAF